MVAPTLFDELATLPNPRGFRGRVHPLSAFLGLVTLAMLMGRTGLIGIARFGRQHGVSLAHALGFRRGNPPVFPLYPAHYGASLLTPWKRFSRVG